MLIGIRNRHTPVRFAPLAMTRHYWEFAVPLSQGAFFDIQPQFGFALLFIRPVAFEAGVRKDWPDIPIELNATGFRLTGHSREGGRACQKT